MLRRTGHTLLDAASFIRYSIASGTAKDEHACTRIAASTTCAPEIFAHLNAGIDAEADEPCIKVIINARVSLTTTRIMFNVSIVASAAIAKALACFDASGASHVIVYLRRISPKSPLANTTATAVHAKK